MKSRQDRQAASNMLLRTSRGVNQVDALQSGQSAIHETAAVAAAVGEIVGVFEIERDHLGFNPRADGLQLGILSHAQYSSNSSTETVCYGAPIQFRQRDLHA
jgi:hypothetical protein